MGLLQSEIVPNSDIFNTNFDITFAYFSANFTLCKQKRNYLAEQFKSFEDFQFRTPNVKIICNHC